MEELGRVFIVVLGSNIGSTSFPAMNGIYRLQQRLSITGIEAAAILVLCGALTVGLGVRQLQGQPSQPAANLFSDADAEWAERDSLFATEGSDSTTPVQFASRIVPADSVIIPTSGFADTPPSRRASRPRTRSTASANNPVRMNINTADAEMLQRLPRIGPALAGRIIAYRREIGPFTSINQVVNVRGIGEKTLEKMAPWIYVE